MHRAPAFLLSVSLVGCATATAGSPAPVLADMTAAPAPAPPAASPSPSPAPAPAISTRRDDPDARAYGWIAIGAVGAPATIVAVTTSFMMLHQKSVRDAHCDANKNCDSDGYNANSQLSKLGGWNAGAYVLAAAGLGVGAYLVLTHPSNEKQTAVGVSPSGITLKGSF